MRLPSSPLETNDRGARAPSPPATRDANPTSAFSRELERGRRDLLKHAIALRDLVPTSAEGFIETATDTLKALHCRIAVIGQVKAGKSSFVNALIQKPLFLPTDINPWTTAITRLNFGLHGTPEKVAMSFRFFDVDEWDRLQNGTGFVRELTERVVPGFESELLRRNIDAIRRRAVQRIGDDFDSLLGKTHTYETYSRDVLQRYICAGHDHASANTSDDCEKTYSDIIQSADIYFPQEDGQFPTTIIDTPGTNDPFMVRDEITRRALEDADIYIVVIMARQALSNADVALLRILRGLHKERIVVFVNRIDELGDIVQMTPRVVQHVRDGLAREFPGTDIPVLAGSALWANAATTGDANRIRALLTADASAYAAQLTGARNPVEASSDHDLAGTLLRCSGLPDLFRVLNQNALNARPGHIIRQVAASLSEVARLCHADLLRERRAIKPSAPVPGFDPQAFEELRNEIADDARRSERLLEALGALLVDLEARFTQVIDVACEEVEQSLRGNLLRYRDQECERLMDTLTRGATVGRWRADTSGIRRVFETSVLNHFKTAEQHFDFLATAVCDQLDRLLKEWAPDTPEGVAQPQERVRAQPPSVTALGQFLVLDLSEPFWRRWLMLHLSPAERVDNLDRLIVEEFGEIISSLVEAFEARLEELRAGLDMRLSLYHALIVAAVEKRSQNALARLGAMEERREAWRQGQERKASHDGRAADLDRRIEELEGLARSLQELPRTWSENSAA